VWNIYFEFARPHNLEVIRERLSRSPDGIEITFGQLGDFSCAVEAPHIEIFGALDYGLRKMAMFLQNERLAIRPEAIRASGTATGEPVPELVGLAEAAQILQVSTQRAGQLAKLPSFPKPVQRLRMGPVYTRRAVVDFHRNRRRERHPDRPPAGRVATAD
jgi:hypothetical protein